MSKGRDTLKPGRGRLSQFIGETKAKFKDPGFQKDLAVYGGIASIIPIGRAISAGKKMVGAFTNTSNQYRKLASKGLPKSMQAMFEAPAQYARAITPQATTTAKVVAKKNKDLAKNIINSTPRTKAGGGPHPIISGGRDMTRFNSGKWTGN